MNRPRFWLALLVSTTGLTAAPSARAYYDDGAMCAVPAEQWSSEPFTSEPQSEPQACELDEGVIGLSPPPTPQAELAAARAAFARADALTAAGQPQAALLELRTIEQVMPRLADVIALRRSDLLRKLEMPQEARAAYAIALESPNRALAARAEIGRVYALIQGNDRRAESELQDLVRRYPLVAERHDLRLQLAYARERTRNRAGAITLLRTIDLEAPASPAAAQARVELERLRAQGATIRPLTGPEIADRAERFMRDSPIEVGAAEVERLLAMPKLPADARARLTALSQKVARLQARWSQAETHLHTAPKAATAASEDAAARAATEKRVRAIRGGRPTSRLNNGQLRALLELAIQAGEKTLCDEVLDALTKRRTVIAPMRFEAAMRTAGLASDDKLVPLLQSLLEVPTYRIAARYHLARALERLGRNGEAQAEYARVMTADRGSTPYYAMWAKLRYETLRKASPDTGSGASSNAIASTPAPSRGAVPGQATQSWVGVALNHGAQPEPSPLAHQVEAPLQGTAAGELRDELDALEDGEGIVPPGPPAPPVADLPAEQRPARARELLASVALRHGEAYPWLQRAIDLIDIGANFEAAEELNEAFLAWRDVTNQPRLRSGLVSVMTGKAPGRRSVTGAQRAKRRALDASSRMSLSLAANLLGDPGIGLRLGSYRPDSRPRAYSEQVEQAAGKYGLDPNLLFAVMRVESIYNRRIVSNAGAIGLMQIMPATGRRIASTLGVPFDVPDLLDPETNLEFSAWYLASLIKRFDGRLPLAIASYNGGPHNVRLWMRQSNPNIPLDAFLERIPFSQTHRYVRRVLTHYAAYRAQKNLAMTQLSVELPSLGPDTVGF